MLLRLMLHSKSKTDYFFASACHVIVLRDNKDKIAKCEF